MGWGVHKVDKTEAQGREEGRVFQASRIDEDGGQVEHDDVDCQGGSVSASVSVSVCWGRCRGKGGDALLHIFWLIMTVHEVSVLSCLR